MRLNGTQRRSGRGGLQGIEPRCRQLVQLPQIDLSIFTSLNIRLLDLEIPFNVWSVNSLCLYILQFDTDLLLSSSNTADMLLKGKQNQSIRTANESFGNVETFKYLGMTLTNQNDIHDEINSRLNSGNACYYSVQNLLTSRLI
jgi:hypothetical protein